MDFDRMWSAIAQNEALQERLIGTIVLLVALFVFRSISLGAVRAMKWRDEQARLTWHVRIRHVVTAIFMLGVVAIWSSQLRSLALSAVAIAAALVIATKELILCFSGSFVRTATDAYKVGDRIEIGDTRGIVVNYGPLATTLLEIGPSHRRTGRTVTVPNSRLLTEAVVNETSSGTFVLHHLTIPLASADGWERLEEQLLLLANEICADEITGAQDVMDASSKRYGLPDADVTPRVAIELTDADKMLFHLRIPCRASQRTYIEQEILRRFLALRVSA